MIKYIRINIQVLLVVTLIGNSYSAESTNLVSNTEAKEIVNKHIESLNRAWDVQERVSAVAYPLLVANSELCGKKTKHDIGVNWITIGDFEVQNQRFAAIQMGIAHLPYLTLVVAGSPAEQAGLIRGDTLLSINGDDFPIAPDRYDARIKPLGDEYQPMYRWRVNRKINKSAQSGSSVTLTYLRGNDRHSVSIQPLERCNFDVLVYEANAIGLLTAGRTIIVSSSLYDFVESDVELQMFIAHEVAHNIKNHPIKRRVTRALGTVADFFVNAPILLAQASMSDGDYKPPDKPPINIFENLGARAFKKRYELEADYIAAYLLERIGVDSSEMAKTWGRVPADSSLLDSHVRSADRVAKMQAGTREINEKQQKKEPLIPSSSRRR